MSTREGAEHPWISRTFSVESGPQSWPRGAVGERDVVRQLDALVELKPGKQPKNYFVLLISPHRNGNSALLARLLPQIGRGRVFSTLHLPWAKGWDPQQYPRLLEALLPAFRTSQRVRDRFQLRYSAARRRLAYYSLDVLLPVVVFLLVELLFAVLLGNWPHLGGAAAPAVQAEDTLPLQQLRDVPGWAHLTCVLVAFAVHFLNRKRELLLETFHRRRPPPGYQLDDDDRELLAGREARDFKPLLEEMHAQLPGAALIGVDRSDGLDDFSEQALLRFLFDDDTRQHGNRLVLLHAPDRESLLYRKLKKRSAEFVNPDETFIELKLQPVGLEDRKRIAAALGKDERDALAPTLVADLVESDTPRRAGLRSAWADLVQQEQELAGDSANPEPGAALLLALLAAGGARGPRQFGLKELRRILTTQRTTFQRWTAAFGRRSWYPQSLQLPLQYLNEGFDVPLIERRNAMRGDPQWIVPAEVCRIVLDQLAKTTSYLGGVHAFWAVYQSERFSAPPAGEQPPASEESDKGDDAETATDPSLASVVDLSWQLSRAVLPLGDRQLVSAEAQALGRSLLAAFNRAVGELLERAQFGRAHALLVRALTEVVAIDGLWAAADFVSEVETLSDHAWRLAAILGVSEEILGFHKLLGERGGRTASKGIEASVAIWDLYYRGIALEELDREAAMAHRISGGDAETRARLENLRRYALNVNLVRPQALVVDGLERLGNELDDAAQAVLPNLLEPIAAPTPDLFEYLVGIQCARVRFGLEDLDGGCQALQQLSARVAANQSWDREDLFAEAVWHLARAEACLIGLEALTHHGPLVLANDAFRASMALTFGVALGGHPDPSELSQRLTEGAIDALEEAHFLQQLCNLSLGLACLLGARVRLGRVLLKPGTTAGKEELASWQHGATVTQAMRCSCLHFGILITRALAHTEIEVCSDCIRSACQEALRQGLDRPARCLGRYFADVVLNLGDKDLYRAAADVVGYALSGTPPAAGTPAYLDWVNLAADRGQLLRLAGDVAGARAALEPALDHDPAGYAKDLRDRALYVYRHLHLQACWCCEQLEDSAGCEQELERLLATPEVDLWKGYPHLVHQRWKLDMAAKLPRPQAIGKAVHAFRRIRDSYVAQPLLLLGHKLLAATAGGDLRPELRNEVILFAKGVVSRVSEWAGIHTSLAFLSQAIDVPELATPEVQAQHQEFFAREATLESRKAEVRRQLANRRPDMLLDYILRHFGHRIAWLDEADGFAGALRRRIGASQLDGVRDEEIERCIALARNVSSGEGRLVVHGALPVLVAIHYLDPQAALVAGTLAAEIFSTIWRATEEILRAAASLEFVTANVAKAMRTYLEISEEFSQSVA